MRLHIFILLISIVSVSCKSTKVDSPNESEMRKLVLSHGGGFTGNYNVYTILENGQVFKGTKTQGVNSKEKSLPNDVADQIFSNYETLDLKNVKIVTYGNLLYSIKMIEGDDSHEISWEKGDKGSENLQLFFRNVMNRIKINNGEDANPNGSKIKAKF